VLIIGSHNLSFAHGKTELDIITRAWEKTLDKLAEAASSNILDHLDGGLVTAKGVR